MKPLVPRYGAGALADVVPSVLGGLALPGAVNLLDLPPARRVCLLLVDGLGWELLRAHTRHVPFLSGLAATQQPITAGFPATTATSISAIGTGTPTGEHGIVGYTFAVQGQVLNALGWHRHGAGKPVDLRDDLVPEDVQPRGTALQRAADAGVTVTVVSPRDHRGSGLTRAVLRGGRFQGFIAVGDLVSGAVQELRRPGPVLCYAYHPDLDLLGHVYGPGSEPWCQQLRVVDGIAAAIAEELPSDGLLLVTADHGMVTIPVEERIDIDETPQLQAGVAAFGGEARVRHVYAEDGAVDDVAAAWTEYLGERSWVLRRDEAVDAGWFGPTVADHVRPRIGDLVVAARGSTALVRTHAEPFMSGLTGQHGSLTAEEQLIPLLTKLPSD